MWRPAETGNSPGSSCYGIVLQVPFLGCLYGSTQACVPEAPLCTTDRYCVAMHRVAALRLQLFLWKRHGPLIPSGMDTDGQPAPPTLSKPSQCFMMLLPSLDIFPATRMNLLLLVKCPGISRQSWMQTTQPTIPQQASRAQTRGKLPGHSMAKATVPLQSIVAIEQ
ncbi:hypothetical protein F5884DRAFT_182011 [Xylogone sp. PMI_703]|nr:hypothetical protein F5884DRAFT_182011 [Xylogone sp. PMI_703]